MDEVKENYDDRRKYPRLNLRVNVTFKVVENMSDESARDIKDTVFENTTKDITPLGVCIETGKKIPVNTVIEMKLHFPETIVPAIGQVVWSNDFGTTGTYYAGVKFMAINNKHFDQFTQGLSEFYISKYKESGEKEAKSYIMDLFKKVFKI